MLIFVCVIMIASSYAVLSIESANTRGWAGAVLAVLFLLGLQIVLRIQANKDRQKKIRFFDLIVTSEDNRYSLTRFQIYLWTAWVVIAFAQAAFAAASLPHLDASLAILMGINGLTTTLSTAATDVGKLAAAPEPDFYRDIFLDKNGTLDLPRVQMFIWTVVILMAYMFMFWKGYQGNKFELPAVDTGLLVLMGVSNGAYLGVKAAQNK